MPTEGSDESVSITTYIPAHQKTEWENHAEELEMSLSEFVRAMVQAGRQGFGDDNYVSTQSSDPNPGENMEKMVLQALADHENLKWEELIDYVHGDLEESLEQALLSLQETGQIAHRPRNGAYTLAE